MIVRRSEFAQVAETRIPFCVHSGDGDNGSDIYKAGAIAFGGAPDSLADIEAGIKARPPKVTHLSINATGLSDAYTLSYVMNKKYRTGGFSVRRDKEFVETTTQTVDRVGSVEPGTGTPQNGMTKKLLEKYCNGNLPAEKEGSGEIGQGDWEIIILGKVIKGDSFQNGYPIGKADRIIPATASSGSTPAQ